MIIRNALLVVLALLAVVFIAGWRRVGKGTSRPSLAQLAIGFLTNFFDTLGIGSFATTTNHLQGAEIGSR